jgi:hypothetical protein
MSGRVIRFRRFGLFVAANPGAARTAVSKPLHWLLSCLLLLVSNSAPAAVVTVNAAQDTYIKGRSSETCLNFGASTSLVVDRESTDLQRALLRFDLIRTALHRPDRRPVGAVRYAPGTAVPEDQSGNPHFRTRETFDVAAVPGSAPP